MLSNDKFVDACISGDALLEEIDDYIEFWHKNESDEELYEFLGFSEFEYDMWLEDPESLRIIMFCRVNNINSEEYVRSSEFKKFINGNKLAARAVSKEEALKVTEWLKRIGKFDEDK